MASNNITELQSTENSIFYAIRSSKKKISVVGERYTGKTYLANSLGKLPEFKDYKIIDCQYETDGKFPVESLNETLNRILVAEKIIFFVQDYFMPKKKVPNHKEIPDFTKIKEVIQESTIIRHLVSEKEARTIADVNLRDLLGIFKPGSAEMHRISMIVDAIVDDSKFGKSYFPGIIMEGVEFVKKDQKLRDILSNEIYDSTNNSEFHLRLLEMQAEFKRRRERTDFMLGIFGIEASAMLTAADGILDSIKSALSGIVTPMVSTLLGCGVIGLIAVSTGLMIKSSHKDNSFMLTFTKSKLAWKEMTETKKHLIAYRIEAANQLEPMTSYGIIDEVFSGDAYRNGLLREFKSLVEKDRMLLQQRLEEATSEIMKHIEQIKEMVESHEKRIVSIEDDIRFLKEELDRIKSSYCLPSTITEEAKIRSVFYPTRKAQIGLDLASKGKNLIITGISGSGKTSTAAYIAMILRDKGNVKSICINNDISLNYGMAVFMENSAIVIDDAFGENDITLSHTSQLQRLLDVISRKNTVILTSQSHILTNIRWLYPTFFDYLTSNFSIIEIDPEELDDSYWRGLYENYMNVFSTGSPAEIVQTARSIEPMVTAEIRMPVSYEFFFRNFFRAPKIDNTDVKNLIQNSKNLRKSMAMRYISLEREDRNFVKLACLFPNMSMNDFKTAYKRFYGEDVSREDVESLRTRNEIFLKDNNSLNIVHSECSEGIWDKIAENVDDVKDLLKPVMKMFEFFETRLQAISCIIQVINKYSSLGSEKIVSDFIMQYIEGSNAHERHLAAYLISEILNSISEERFLNSVLSSLKTDEGLFDAAFLLKSMSRNRKWEKLAVHETESLLSNPDISEQFMNVLKSQIYYSKDLIGRLESGFTGKSFDNHELLQYIEKKPDILYSNKNEKNLLKNSEKWNYIGLKSGKFEKIFLNSYEWIEYTETREDNLGRLYLNLDDLVSSKLLVEGNEYIIEARIMTENVKSAEKPDICGATVGVAYADDACWTPRKDAFQIEIGFVQGTTADTLYQGRFRLGFMPPGCTHLILYLVNVVGTGICLFRDIVLRNAE